MMFILSVKLAIRITVRSNEQHLSGQTLQRRGSIWDDFKDPMRKKTTSTDGGPEGLPEVTYSIRVLRTMKKTETGQSWEQGRPRNEVR